MFSTQQLITGLGLQCCARREGKNFFGFLTIGTQKYYVSYTKMTTSYAEQPRHLNPVSHDCHMELNGRDRLKVTAESHSQDHYYYKHWS